jgi:hypothetical protein
VGQLTGQSWKTVKDRWLLKAFAINHLKGIPIRRRDDIIRAAGANPLPDQPPIDEFVVRWLRKAE